MLNTKPIFDNKGVFWFLGLTFGLTYLIDLGIYLRGGLTSPGWYMALTLTGMMPAFSAILLGLFFLPGSPIYYRRSAGWGRWFYYFFLLYTLSIAIAEIQAETDFTAIDVYVQEQMEAIGLPGLSLGIVFLLFQLSLQKITLLSMFVFYPEIGYTLVPTVAIGIGWSVMVTTNYLLRRRAAVRVLSQAPA